MTTIPHDPSPVLQEQPHWSLQLLVPEMWASLAIIVMWLSVLFDAVYGPDIVSTDVAGNHTTVPSAVVLALFAFLGTWVVAKYGFRHEPRRD
jgi:uncharacterized membrane protein (DUF485 family)